MGPSFFSRTASAAALAFGALGLSCVDPVTDDAVAALGPEAPGVKEGPTHRPGQPCLTCHGDTGPGSPKMAVGGTVFQDSADGSPGQGGVTVRMTDATGRFEDRITNSVGNFYVFLEEWQPVWPLQVMLTRDVEVEREIEVDGKKQTIKETVTKKSTMSSLLNGRVGCATCHKGAQATSRSLPRLSFGGGS